MAGDPDDTGAADDWVLVTRAVAAAQRRALEPIEAAGLPAQDFAALQLLLRSPNHRLPMNVITRDLSMTSGGLSKLVHRLAVAGLIDRRGTSTDRRRRFAGLTPAGLELARHAAAEYEAAVRSHIVNVIGTDQLSAIADTLRPLDPARDPEPDIEPDIEADIDIGPVPPRDPSLPDRRKRTDPPPHE
jgi:DNA-binding MarR family transcriptional regulator